MNPLEPGSLICFQQQYYHTDHMSSWTQYLVEIDNFQKKK